MHHYNKTIPFIDNHQLSKKNEFRVVNLGILSSQTNKTGIGGSRIRKRSQRKRNKRTQKRNKRSRKNKY
jgi:hypothetical protein